LATAHISGSEAPVRLPFIALSAASTWLIFRLTALLFDDAADVRAAVPLNPAPVFTPAGGCWVLPDGQLGELPNPAKSGQIRPNPGGELHFLR